MKDVESNLARRRPTALERVTQRRPTIPDARFQQLPEPVGPWPYRKRLADVIGQLDPARPLRFHCVGDTGGHRDAGPQHRVAAAMAAELHEDDPARFFFHLGDVAYPHGEPEHYRAQFHHAYGNYTAPIFAVPGNHDAENPRLEGELALAPWCAHFCSDTPPLHEAGAAFRPAAGQPHVHWTLIEDRVRIVGLWANHPEGGQFAPDQLEWLIHELADTPPDTVLILALHQPVYSADVTHGSNLALVDVLDACSARAGRGPDAVFSGHAHVYERFTRRRDGREIPHIVAGAGGYPELHPLGEGVPPLPATFAGVDDVTLDACVDTAHGFMTVTVEDGAAEVVYTTAGPEGPRVADRFAIIPPGLAG
jgi:3',5'-cyclic AMP phosphodiesterase CpdA